jgi:hypothetical protein
MSSRNLLKLAVGGLALLAAELYWFGHETAELVSTPILIALIGVLEWRMATRPLSGVRNAFLSCLILSSWFLSCSNTVNIGAGLYILNLLVRRRSFWGGEAGIFERASIDRKTVLPETSDALLDGS